MLTRCRVALRSGTSFVTGRRATGHTETPKEWRIQASCRYVIMQPTYPKMSVLFAQRGAPPLTAEAVGRTRVANPFKADSLVGTSNKFPGNRRP
jgi:hypothetical protein